MHPRGQALRNTMNTMHPREIRFSDFISMYHRGELKLMHKMQWKDHTGWSIPSLPNLTKATNARGNMRGRARRRNTKYFQYLDPKDSPTKRRDELLE